MEPRGVGLPLQGQEEHQCVIRVREGDPSKGGRWNPGLVGPAMVALGRAGADRSGLRNTQAVGVFPTKCMLVRSEILILSRKTPHTNCLHDGKGVWGWSCVVFPVVPAMTTRWRPCPGRLSLDTQSSDQTFPPLSPAEQLQQKDQQILLLLEEKEMIFRDMTECSTPLPEESSPAHSSRVLFRSSTEEALKGGPLMKSAINEGNHPS